MDERGRYEDGRVSAALDRLIANIPAACKRLEEEGHVSLAGQLRRDTGNLVYLVYWQEDGGLSPAAPDQPTMEQKRTGSAQRLIGTIERCTVGPPRERILSRLEALARQREEVAGRDVEQALRDEAAGRPVEGL